MDDVPEAERSWVGVVAIEKMSASCAGRSVS
jgi:hypothetical protein